MVPVIISVNTAPSLPTLTRFVPPNIVSLPLLRLINALPASPLLLRVNPVSLFTKTCSPPLFSILIAPSAPAVITALPSVSFICTVPSAFTRKFPCLPANKSCVATCLAVTTPLAAVMPFVVINTLPSAAETSPFSFTLNLPSATSKLSAFKSPVYNSPSILRSPEIVTPSSLTMT